MLIPELTRELMQLHQWLESNGELPSRTVLDQYYATFRERFGPDQLRRLDGEALLEYMHLHGNRDSMVYWLEFKNDEELPGMFGSIAGGSAHKFGVFRSSQSGAWIKGSPQHPQEITIDEAIQIARENRDQLLRGCALLDQFPHNGSDADYARLQDAMNYIGPVTRNVSALAWGHKYFSLLYPELLDDFHNPDYQRFHLIKLLQTPPGGDGRYIAAGHFVALAAELAIPINHVTSLMNRRNGAPYRYWRINPIDGATGENAWERMWKGNFVAIGWPHLEELSGIELTRRWKERVQALMEERYPQSLPEVKRATQQVFNFAVAIKPSNSRFDEWASSCWQAGRSPIVES